MSDRLCIMDAGAVVQIGRPMDVYRRPRSTFVARFLGVSPMNLFDADVIERGGGYAARFAGGEIPLPGFAPAAATGAKVTVGVRPEHLRLADGESATPVAGRVRALEPLGAETLVVAELAGLVLTARAGGDCDLAKGDAVTLYLRPADVHLFDAATGLAVGART